MQPCFSSIDHDDKLIAVHGLAGLVGGADAAELLDSPGIVVNYRERKSKWVKNSTLLRNNTVKTRLVVEDLLDGSPGNIFTNTQYAAIKLNI